MLAERNKAFQILWRTAILVLPWQTRWLKGAELGGWNFEQGSIAVYASWFLIFLVVVMGFWQKHKSVSPGLMLKMTGSIFILITISVLGTDFNVRALTAISQWWCQVTLLIFFILTVYQAGIPIRKFAFWFVVSLIPHVALGFWQYSEQLVVGSKWLGMAEQRPENLGVSVIEHGLFRVLRMYGGFPHPNIFSGWVAIGFIVSLWLAATASLKWRALGQILVSCVLSVALLLSYARSAWIAAMAGILFLSISLIHFHLRTRQKPEASESVSLQFFLIALISSVLVALAVALTQADHLATRFDPTKRLEAKSLETRISSLRQGFDVFRKNLWFGTGPNAELVILAKEKDIIPAPLESPHNVFILAIINFGLIGVAFFVYLFYRIRKFLRHLSWTHELAMPVLISAVILAMLDYYPWSYWPGQVLFGVCFLLICLDENSKNA